MGSLLSRTNALACLGWPYANSHKRDEMVIVGFVSGAGWGGGVKDHNGSLNCILIGMLLTTVCLTRTGVCR